MTVMVSIPSQQYTPRTLNISPAIPAGTKTLLITLTREAWPVGAVGSIAIKFPDGSDAASVSFDGGDLVDSTRAVSTKSGLRISGQKIGGVVQDMPEGIYATTIVILQTLNTAVLAERF